MAKIGRPCKHSDEKAAAVRLMRSLGLTWAQIATELHLSDRGVARSLYARSQRAAIPDRTPLATNPTDGPVAAGYQTTVTTTI